MIQYSSIGKKKGSLKAKTGKVVMRRLPRSISRYCLLFRLILEVMEYELKENIPLTWAVKHLFSLHSNPSLLDVRHLWIDIVNVVLGITKTNTNLPVAASQSGHSETTHEDFYVTDTMTNDQFARFHQGIGDELPIFATEASVNVADCLEALKSIHGMGAGFYPGQEDLIAAFLTRRHLHAVLPCGHGKSMLWKLPALAARANGARLGTTLVVLPYRFLVDHFIYEA